MANKRAEYDNPAGYGHGGMGWQPGLDEMPGIPAPPAKAPSWLPWVGLAGAGLLGYAGLKGLSRAFRGAPKATKTLAESPIPLWEREIAGHESPMIQRRINTSTDNIAASGYKMSSVISALGRIARGQ